MRSLEILQAIPLRQWTGDELGALRRARIPLRRTTTRRATRYPPFYVMIDCDTFDLDILDGEAWKRLIRQFAKTQKATQ